MGKNHYKYKDSNRNFQKNIIVIIYLKLNLKIKMYMYLKACKHFNVAHTNVFKLMQLIVFGLQYFGIKTKIYILGFIFNRPGVAGGVLQTPSSQIH